MKRARPNGAEAGGKPANGPARSAKNALANLAVAFIVALGVGIGLFFLEGVASVFLPEGKVVVSTDSRTQGHAVYKTVGGNLPKVSVVVLIDRNTASAAEILTAALADDAGAKVVGTRSYGKGVFQQELKLSNGGALKLTVGEYFTPHGVNLAKSHGIHPDVQVRDDPKTRRDEARERALGVLAAQ